MITGKSYAEVKAGFSDRDWVSEAGGVPCAVAGFAYLAEHGFAVAPKYRHYYPLATDRELWPVEPFADIHICTVMTNRSHAVIMLNDGAVLDPNLETVMRLSDYSRVDMIAGVVSCDKALPHSK